MFVKPRYIIKEQFLWMTGYYDRYGKMCTLVTETKRSFIVNQSPLEILEFSISCIGYELKGARNTAKRLLGNVHHCPILVNPIRRIVLFPTRSPLHEDCIWFNPAHIKRTRSHNYNTIIMFSNGKTVTIPAKLSAFNDKIKRAEQLEEMTRYSSFLLTLNEQHNELWMKVDRRNVSPIRTHQYG